jgi:hypothetical protein
MSVPIRGEGRGQMEGRRKRARAWFLRMRKNGKKFNFWKCKGAPACPICPVHLVGNPLFSKANNK